MPSPVDIHSTISSSTSGPLSHTSLKIGGLYKEQYELKGNSDQNKRYKFKLGNWAKPSKLLPIAPCATGNVFAIDTIAKRMTHIFSSIAKIVLNFFLILQNGSKIKTSSYMAQKSKDLLMMHSEGVIKAEHKNDSSFTLQ